MGRGWETEGESWRMKGEREGIDRERREIERKGVMHGSHLILSEERGAGPAVWGEVMYAAENISKTYGRNSDFFFSKMILLGETTKKKCTVQSQQSHT